MQKTATGIRVEVRLFSVRARQSVFAREYSGSAAQPAVLRAHHLRRDPPAAAGAAGRGADEADVLVGPRPRARRRHRREPRGEGGLHRRLRRGEPAAGHRQPHAEHHARPGRRTARDRVHVVPARLPRHLRVAHLRGHAAERRPRARARTGCRPGRPDGTPDRVHVESRRQCRALRDEPRRLERAAPHEQPGHRHHADLVADRPADRVHVRPVRRPAGLRDGRRRAQPAARSRPTSYCDRPTWSPAPFNELAFVCRTGPRLRHQDLRLRLAATIRQITFGEGSNESPSYSPNGRHLAFMSTRGREERRSTRSAATARASARSPKSATTSRPTGHADARSTTIA